MIKKICPVIKNSCMGNKCKWCGENDCALQEIIKALSEIIFDLKNISQSYIDSEFNIKTEEEEINEKTIAKTR